MRTLDAILPAGGTAGPELAKAAGTPIKALIPIEGTPILERTLQAVKQSQTARRIALIGSQTLLDHPAAALADFKLKEAATGPENLYNGLNALLAQPDPPEAALIVAVDQPYLDAKMLKAFVDACPQKDVCVPLIRESEFRTRFPGAAATFAKLKDDSWTTGGVFILNCQALIKAKPHIEKVFENRKSKLGMARLLGLSFVFKWLTNRLTLSDVEAKILQLLGASGAAVTGCAPELAFDIDDIDDLQHALQNPPKHEVSA